MIRSALVIAVVVAGCQRVESTVAPHDPLAAIRQTRTVVGTQLRPNVMLLIDTSASMGLPINSAHPSCPAGCGGSGAACPAACPTRLSEVAAGLGSALDQAPGKVRFGLATFPASAGACSATAQADVKVPVSVARKDVVSELVATANDVKVELAKLQPGGNSPTAASLQFFATNGPLNDADPTRPREDFVLLVTDDAPDCNGAELASVALALRKQGLKTIVFGMGEDALTMNAFSALDPTARAGGLARACSGSTDAECGANNSCDPAARLCRRSYFHVTSAADLASQLGELTRTPEGGFNVCELWLEEAPSPLHPIRVFVDGAEVEASAGWSLSQNKVTFSGALCSRMTESTVYEPVAIEIEFVKGY